MHNAMIKKNLISGSEIGTTLVEVLIALSIFVIVAVPSAEALSTNFKVLLINNQRTTAESLAKTQMEAIYNTPYNSTAPYQYTAITDDRYYITPTTVLIDPVTGQTSALDLGVQKITCNVTCKSPPFESIIIQSYKR